MLFCWFLLCLFVSACVCGCLFVLLFVYVVGVFVMFVGSFLFFIGMW